MGAGADGRVNDRIENYTDFWQKDMSQEQKLDTDNRVENYTDVINGMYQLLPPFRARGPSTHKLHQGYYDGATELYEYGWAQSFHFSRFYKGEGFHQSVCTFSSFLFRTIS